MTPLPSGAARSAIVLLMLLLAAVAGAQSVAAPPAAQRADRALGKTALDAYIQRPDKSFHWELVATRRLETHTELVIDLTSQTWRTTAEIDRTVWQHWLVVVVPHQASAQTALLLLGGGSNQPEPPKEAGELPLGVALATRTVVAELGTVPNQPLALAGDAEGRTEDSLLAASWNRFLETDDPDWLAQLPMTRSAVAAMTAVEQCLAQVRRDGSIADAPRVDRFVVAGGSKRGWTSWLTAAVDPRVVGVAPVVIDMLNMRPSMRHHLASYGEWSEALNDYQGQGLADLFDDEAGASIRRIVDPYVYRRRLTMPKCIISATQDEFFLPDSSRYYFEGLVGEKHLSYTPNTGHSLKGSDALDTLVAFHASITHGLSRPTVAWTGDHSAAEHVVSTSIAPTEAVLWRAENPRARDFRFPVVGPAFKPTTLQPEADGGYRVAVRAPAEGWSATFVRFTFEIGAPKPWRISTPVWVAPDVEPFADKPGSWKE